MVGDGWWVMDGGCWMLDGLNFQSSELSPPWLSAAGAFFCHIFALFDFLDTCFAKKRDF